MREELVFKIKNNNYDANKYLFQEDKNQLILMM